MSAGMGKNMWEVPQNSKNMEGLHKKNTCAVELLKKGGPQKKYAGGEKYVAGRQIFPFCPLGVSNGIALGDVFSTIIIFHIDF